jgi:hypothetical protein
MKTEIAPTPNTKEQSYEARKRVLQLIERAQSLLYEATQTACPLQGWCKQWEQIGDHADATKALWHKINRAPLPIGHD